MKKPVSIAYLATLLMIAALTVSHAQNITVTLAGGGTSGAAGDGGPSIHAQLVWPTDVCMDAAHNIYIADIDNRIRKISARNGVITNYAGGGSSAADGVPAINASLAPAYMCIDAAGNIYTTSGNKVRKITAATGIITTVAGAGANGYSGDGGPATDALLNRPGGICIDAAGNLYIVDGGEATIQAPAGTTVVTYIRKISTAGIITTLAGTGTAGYTGDGGPATAAQTSCSIAICVNAAGDIFFSDQPGSLAYGGGYIRKISAASGVITTVAGNGGYPADGDGGPATAAALGNIFGMCFDTAGNLYIDDISCSCRRIDKNTGIINTLAGSATLDGYNGDGQNSLIEQLNYPYGVFVDPTTGDLLIADHQNSRMRKAIQLTHTPRFALGNGQFISPCPGVAFAIDTQMSVADLDASQTETWTVVSAPLHGTLLGFPATATSQGTSSLATTSGASYQPYSAYSGNDSFRVQVSDGALSSIVTIYVSATCGAASTLHAGTLTPRATFSVFPNPASSLLNLLWTSGKNNAPVVITDVTGTEVYHNTWTAKTGIMRVDISSLPPGVYLVAVDGTNTRKFVKE